ncbi:MAG: hypothetical protein ABEJ87_01665 [Candidatus Nanohalobium sp.]
MKLDEDYTLQELENGVEDLKNPLSSAVKNPEVYRDATEAFSGKIGSYTSGDLYRMLEDPEASQQQLGFFSSAMQELGLVFDSDGSLLDREYGRRRTSGEITGMRSSGKALEKILNFCIVKKLSLFGRVKDF